MKIGVTGSSGRVGRALVKQLSVNHNVVSFSREKGQQNSCYWNITETPTAEIMEALVGIEVLFHCAAKIPTDFSDYKEASDCINTNSLAVLNVLQAADKAGVAKVVLVSGTNFIRTNSKSESTLDLCYDCSYAPAYFVSKVAGELFFESYQATRTRKLIVRLSSIYSERHMPGLYNYAMSCLVEHKKIEVYGDGSFQADYLHVDDAVWALAKLGISSVEGAINVGSGHVTSNIQMVQKICQAKGLVHNEHVVFKKGNTRQNSMGFAPVKLAHELHDLNFRPRQLQDVMTEILK
jgi:nucleoside-diphosphate-sugar epimerase